MLEKIFKKICLILSALLVLSSISLAFIPRKNLDVNKFSNDFLGCKAVVESVKNLELKQTTIIYVKNSDDKWEEYQRLHGNENRILIEQKDLSENLKNAFIAIEDERFITHKGVDWKRTFLAMGNLIFKYYSSNQGGSTITQQLIKNITDDRDDSGLRKIREIVRALYLETKVNKDEILNAYLNTIALGNGLCGVQAAANYYFNKDAKDLTLLECASIAAITKHPNKYDPKNNPNDNKTRRNSVLKKMLELEMISKEDFDENYNADLKLDLSQKHTYEVEINNYFVDALIEDVIDDLTKLHNCTEEIASTMLYNGGYRIYSTMDTDIQSAIENAYVDRDKYFNRVSKTSGQKIQSAMTITDYEGHIVGLVGGVGEKTSNRSLNRATQTPQQPGSTMKPVGVYTLAIEKEYYNYSSILLDKPLPNYKGKGKPGPSNAGRGYKGDVTLQYALETSLNTIPVRLLEKVGVNTVYKFLTEKLNFNSLTEIDMNASSLTLGGCQYGITTTESAAAFSIFGNGGKYFEPTTYYHIEDANGEVVLAAEKEGSQVVSEKTATVMNRLLQRVVYGPEGTGSGVGYSCAGMKVFGKTGTTSDNFDYWFVGGSPYYVCSMWYGYDENENFSNNGVTKKVWKAVMKDVHEDLKYKDFDYSKDVYSRTYCVHTGKIALDSCTDTAVGYYKKGTVPGKCDGVHKSEESESASQSSTGSSSASTSLSSSSSSASTSSATSTTSVSSSSSVSSSKSEVSSESVPSSKPTSVTSSNASSDSSVSTSSISSVSSDIEEPEIPEIPDNSSNSTEPPPSDSNKPNGGNKPEDSKKPEETTKPEPPKQEATQPQPEIPSQSEETNDIATQSE